MGKRHVKITRVNWDVEYFISLKSCKGFTITEPVDVSIDGSKKKSLFGPRSELYGTTYGDEQEFAEQYQCECGTLKGAAFENEICPICKKPVKAVGDDIKITGWVSLGIDKIINPMYYQLLSSAIGKTVFPDIVTSRKKVDKNGKISRPDIYADPDKPPLSPFSGIGIDEFRKRYYEILDYFIEKRKHKANRLEYLKRNARAVFCSHIPIYTTKLRQQSITTDTFYYGGLDKQINPIVSLSLLLKDCTEIEKPNYLQSIQKKVNAMWEYNFELLNGKEGLIRGQILGGSLNYTSRNVIIPDHTLHDNEVDISYHTFLDIYKDIIIRYLKITENMSDGQAIHEWSMAKVRFSKKVYEIMNFIVEQETPTILLNRNPTLNFYSMLLLKIRRVKESFDDYTLSVPLSSLPGLNADFDGDILNIIGILTNELKYIFRKFDPVERMIMSRDTGFLNPYFTITKGQLIDLFYFCLISKGIEDLPKEAIERTLGELSKEQIIEIMDEIMNMN